MTIHVGLFSGVEGYTETSIFTYLMDTLLMANKHNDCDKGLVQGLESIAQSIE